MPQSLRMIRWCLAACLLLHGGAAAAQGTFTARVAAFDARARQMSSATDPEARGAATLAWLEALRAVVDVENIGAAEKRWLEAREDLVFYNEIGGAWMIQTDAIWRAHDRVKGTTAADDIAWLAVTNGLGGECEGYVPCHVEAADRMDGEYLRRHPQGRHTAEALERIDNMLSMVVDDLLKRPEKNDYLKVPDDCADLLKSGRALRAAVAGAKHARQANTLRLINRVMDVCSATPRKK